MVVDRRDSDPSSLRRPDSAVLYLPIGSVLHLSDELRRLVSRLRPLLRRPTPQLTRRIADGVGTATQPADGRSFG
jgi:hypothetical protein